MPRERIVVVGAGLTAAYLLQLPRPENLARPRYLRMLGEIARFHRAARDELARPGPDRTLGGFVAAGGFSRYFVEHFLLPVVSAVWWLHTDATLLPAARGAAASWNYLKPDCGGPDRVLVSYDMKRLMRLAAPRPYAVARRDRPRGGGRVAVRATGR